VYYQEIKTIITVARRY